MIVMWPLIILLGMFVFAVGTVVGSFLECVHLSDPMAEKRDLAGLSMSRLHA